jgi:hypothetical protein
VVLPHRRGYLPRGPFKPARGEEASPPGDPSIDAALGGAGGAARGGHDERGTRCSDARTDAR